MSDVGCPSADALIAFAAGGLAVTAEATIEVHVDACASCRRALSSLARASVSPGLGRYRLDGVLGAGGMGVVYRAHDPALARPVAIKVVRGDGDAAERARLVREAQSLARLSHPNVCHVYDVGDDGDDVWLAMELIDGVDLRAWSAGREPAAIGDALLAAARGLAAAHGAGLVHRDVKPANILVARDGRAVVADFGLARSDDGTTTTRSGPGVVAGTPAYLAPEQLTGGAVDARCDQFAWAVTAWELLTGERPFPIEPAARLTAVRAGLTPPRRMPTAFARPLVRALAPVPADRFPSMDALVAAIASGRSPRRGWPIVAAAAGVSAVVAIALVIATRGRDGRPAVRDAGDTVAVASAPVDPSVDPSIDPPPLPLAAEVLDAGVPPPLDAVAAIDAGPPSSRVATAFADARAAAPPPAVAALDAGAASVAALVDASTPDPVTPPPPTQRFDRARAERVLADCRFPVDPAHPDPALDGPIVDWGRVVRVEAVTGVGADGPQPMALVEVRGARGTYRFDGDAVSRLGSLGAAVGEVIVVCPYQLAPTSQIDRRTVPPAWSEPTVPVYAFAPTRSLPRIATELAALMPLHVTEKVVRTAPPPRPLLVWARPRARTATGFDMGGWDLDAAELTGDPLAVGQPSWLVVDRPRAVSVDGGIRILMHGIIARRRLLD